MFDDANWRDLILFHEYFHGDTGQGCGASHQTGWTALIGRLIEDLEPRAGAGAHPWRRRATQHTEKIGP